MVKKRVVLPFARKKEAKNPLNVLIKRAQVLKSGISENQEIILKDFGSLPKFFEAAISKSLLDCQIVGEDCFLCGIYISILLSQMTSSVPPSWYAVDYLLEGYENHNPEAFKEGADVCFLLSSLFKERTNRRATTFRDYRDLGGRLYLDYFAATGKEISVKMSQNFELMAEITKEAIDGLKI